MRNSFQRVAPSPWASVVPSGRPELVVLWVEHESYFVVGPAGADVKVRDFHWGQFEDLLEVLL